MPKVVTSCADIGFIYKFQFINTPKKAAAQSKRLPFFLCPLTHI